MMPAARTNFALAVTAGLLRPRLALSSANVPSSRVARAAGLIGLEQFSATWVRSCDPSSWFNCSFLKNSGMFKEDML
jgi:hypothetical protein